VNVFAVVPAAGKGRRLGSKTPKAYLPVAGQPLFIHTLRALLRAYPFREIVLIADRAKIAHARREIVRARLARVRVVAGGATRAESVKNGLLALPPGVSLAAVHDAARPLVPPSVVRRTIEAAKKTGGAICAIPVSSTVKRIDAKGGAILGTEDRSRLVLAQTPQVFDTALILARYRTLGARAFQATDEAALFDGTRVRVRLVAGDERNFKVTTPGDLARLKRLMKSGE
jgi:2-C-methyl-D-erythritol 4-phosphate cytidylyltransferase